MTKNVYEDKKFHWKDYFPFLITVFSIIAVLSITYFGLKYYFDNTNTNNNNNNNSLIAGFIRDYNPKFGKTDSNIKFVYIFDFQCPACKGADQTIKRIYSEYNDKISFIYKNFPLPIHSQAKPSSYGAQSLYKQNPDKYFDYKEKIYQRQDQLSIETIQNTAKELVSDYDNWKNDFSSKEIRDMIDNDIKDLQNLSLPASSYETGNKISATPSIVILKDDKIQTWWAGDVGYEEIKNRLNKYI